MSLARKTKPTEEELVQSRAELEYWVYDCCLRDQPDMPFSERTAFLQTLKMPVAVRLLHTDIAHNQAELDAYYEQYLAAGYEGQMIRRLDSSYQHTRTRDLLKRKEFVDQEFTLVDVLPGRGSRAEMAAKAVVRLENGETCEVGMIGSHAYCRKLLAEKASVIGKPVTVQYQNRTPDGSLRFGKMKAVRETND
jgi:DNA ligase-1